MRVWTLDITDSCYEDTSLFGIYTSKRRAEAAKKKAELLANANPCEQCNRSNKFHGPSPRKLNE